jgi:hypothetical protein
MLSWSHGPHSHCSHYRFVSWNNKHFLEGGYKIICLILTNSACSNNFPSNESLVTWGRGCIFLICTKAPLGQALAVVTKVRRWQCNDGWNSKESWSQGGGRTAIFGHAACLLWNCLVITNYNYAIYYLFLLINSLYLSTSFCITEVAWVNCLNDFRLESEKIRG